MSVAPILSYSKADRQKKDILKDNSKKTGIYWWINKNSGKSYIGSAINLKRFRNYYSKVYLQSETKKNNSMIYKA